MNWYRLKLTQAEVATGRVQQCREAFEEAFVAARGPRSMALFLKDNDDGGTELFLTPDAVSHAAPLLEKWGCTPCDPPSLLGLRLLVGHNEITYY